MLFQIFLALFYGFTRYEGFAPLIEISSLFKMLNISRAAYVQPFIWGVMLMLSFKIFSDRLHFSSLAIIALTLFQLYYSANVRHFHTTQKEGTFSFEQYYAPRLFERIKAVLPEPIEQHRVISYGLEPAVSLYNGLYTADGYSVNYPLAYKHAFRRTHAACLGRSATTAAVYDGWGSKVYLFCVDSRPQIYKRLRDKNITLKQFSVDTDALCALDVEYLLSAYRFETPLAYGLQEIAYCEEPSALWHIWLYKLECK